MDYYFHNDLARADMPDYRLYVFVNVFCLTEDERQAIEMKVKRNDQTVLWLYAPGFIHPERQPKLSEHHIGGLVGMRIHRTATACNPRFRLTSCSHPVLAGTRSERIYGYFDRPIISGGVASLLPGPVESSLLYPMFYTADPEAVVLGRFLETHRPALSLRRFPAWTSIYCGAKAIRSDLRQTLLTYTNSAATGRALRLSR